MPTIQTSFQLDEGTAQAIDELKATFGVSTMTAVIRKAVALSRIASREADAEEKTVTIGNGTNPGVRVSLVG